MIFEISVGEIQQMLIKQLNSFFPISDKEITLLDLEIHNVIERCERCFEKNKNKYYSKEGLTYFNPFHSSQYATFLYFFSNSIFKYRKDVQLANKLYYLNKIMNACDLFYEVELPEIFMFDHPVGSVMGRAEYGNYFSFGQNCTVGNNKGIFPRIGEGVRMAANSMILGNSAIGDNVIIGAGACVKDENVPANSIVFGFSPNLIVKQIIL